MHLLERVYEKSVAKNRNIGSGDIVSVAGIRIAAFLTMVMTGALDQAPQLLDIKIKI